jgi:predicted solute-binding protein
VVLDHPSTLCRKLAEGQLDVALVSSFEFVRNPIYRVVDGISISSDGAVYSVVVADGTVDRLSEVELDPSSQTSVVLLQYLLDRRGAVLRGSPIKGDVLAPLTGGKARLLIGDQAIRFRHKFGGTYRYLDLGEAWKDLTGLPFVYALWLVRPEVTDAPAVAEQLRSLYHQNFANLDRIITKETEFDPEFCRRYYLGNLRFSFGDAEKKGLQKFAEACTQLKLIPRDKLDLKLV